LLYSLFFEGEKDKSQRIRDMKVQLATMPNANLHTLKFLFAHLVR
jgi:hypothetical protein